MNIREAYEAQKQIDFAKAVTIGLFSAAEACGSSQRALQVRLLQAAKVIEDLLPLHEEVLKSSQLRQQTINQLQKKVDEANRKK